MVAPGNELTLDIEKPAAGGRMLARHDGQVVFVAGAIPGERVRVRVSGVRGGVGYADIIGIERASEARRPVAGDPSCGGMVYAHVTYERQLDLKAAIIADAFARLGRLPLEAPVPVRPSPETGYRMRARLHVRGARAGFFREGTHDLCDAGPTDQLLPETVEVVDAACERLRASHVRDVRGLEISENVPGSERALLVDVTPEAGQAAALRALAAFDDPRATGVGIMRGRQPLASRGEPVRARHAARRGRRGDRRRRVPPARDRRSSRATGSCSRRSPRSSSRGCLRGGWSTSTQAPACSASPTPRSDAGGPPRSRVMRSRATICARTRCPMPTRSSPPRRRSRRG